MAYAFPSGGTMDESYPIAIPSQFDLPDPGKQSSLLQDKPTTAHHQFESLDHMPTQVDRPVELRLPPSPLPSGIDELEVSSASRPPKMPKSSFRTREATTRRNKKRHDKERLKRKQHVVRRRFEADWTITQMKAVLEQFSVQRGQISRKARHVVHINFINDTERQEAESNLPTDTFDEKHYLQWIAEHP